MAKVKVRRTHREELPGMAVLRDAAAAGLSAYPGSGGLLDLDMTIDPDLSHLITHDPDGSFTALDRDETLGFAAAHVRSRQCVLSELWVLPQHRGRGAGDALLAKVLAYGERSGARSTLAMVPPEGAVQSLLLSHGLRPICPVYRYLLGTESAEELGRALARLLPGQEVSRDLLKRRGQADLDRIDQVTRGITREVDHLYWLKTRQLKAAFVRQGERNAAYAYGGQDQAGPVGGSTREAALAAVGWALSLSASQRAKPVRMLVPAPFSGAIDTLEESDATIEATFLLYGRDVGLAFDRCTLGSTSLP